MVKKILILSAIFLGLSSMVIYRATEVDVPNRVNGEYEPIVVLELFTSQGCSSCPPADALLDKAKKQYPEDVYALSYHVDYWNYIGWEDPFSKSKFTKKQREYNIKFRYSSNYTPEMVVNGREHFVGSNSAKLNAKIKQYRQLKSANKVALKTVVQKGQAIDFEYEVDGVTTDKLLRAVLVLDERTTVVKRGENRNRTLKNSNIVVGEKYIPLTGENGEGSIQVPAGMKPNEKLKLIVLVENRELDITAAAKKAI